jgi:hypothetical protein
VPDALRDDAGKVRRSALRRPVARLNPEAVLTFFQPVVEGLGKNVADCRA